MQLDVQLGEVVLLLLQAVVGGVDDGLEDLPRAVHQRLAVAVDLLEPLGQRADARVQFLRAVVQLAGAVVQRLRAVQQVGGAVVELGRAVVEVGAAVPELPRAVVELVRAVVQVGRAVLQVARALVQGLCAVEQVGGAVLEGADAVVQLAGAVLQLRHAVQQAARALVELVAAVGQQQHRVVHLVGHAREIQVKVVVPDVVGNVAGGDGIGAVVRVIGHVRGNDGGGGQVHVEVVVVVQVQRLAHAGQAVADDGAEVARVHYLAVVHLDVVEGILLHAEHGDHDEGHGHLLPGAVDLHGLGLVGRVVDLDLQPAAPAREVPGVDGLAVQLVFEGNAHRQRRVGGALIEDVGPVGVPDHHAVLDGVGLVAADVLDVMKGAHVLQLVQLVGIVQPLADGDLPHAALGVGEGVDGLLLVLGHRRQQHAAQQGEDDDHGDAARDIPFHDACLRFINSSDRAAGGRRSSPRIAPRRD